MGEGTTVQVYYAPVGDPALGPVAFPHRAFRRRTAAGHALASLAGFQPHCETL